MTQINAVRKQNQGPQAQMSSVSLSFGQYVNRMVFSKMAPLSSALSAFSIYSSRHCSALFSGTPAQSRILDKVMHPAGQSDADRVFARIWS